MLGTMSSSREVAASSLLRMVSDNSGHSITGMFGLDWRKQKMAPSSTYVSPHSETVLQEICSVPFDQGCQVIHVVRHTANRYAKAALYQA